jgi:hypothetical protein
VGMASSCLRRNKVREGVEIEVEMESGETPLYMHRGNERIGKDAN